MTPYVVGVVALVIVLFMMFPRRVKEMLNAFLAAEAKHVEIKEAEKAGKAPPHVHGLTINEPVKIDIAKAIPNRRQTPRKPQRHEDET